MKVDNYSYETFPEFDDYVEGMNEVNGDRENLRVRMLDVTYQDDCIIRFVYPNNYFDESLKFPLIIHVQGSGWYKQDMADHIFDYMPIVKAGYVMAIVQYHEAPKYRYPTQINDVKKAIRYLQTHYNEYPIDIQHVFLSGDSSGGHVALMTLFTYDEDLVKLSGMIDFYGITDFVTFYDEGYSKYDKTDFTNIYDLMGGVQDEMPKEYIEASPINHIKEGMNLPPILIMHGSKDHVVPFIQSVKLFNKLKDYGYNVTFYKVNGADHGRNIFYVDDVYHIIVNFLDNCCDGSKRYIRNVDVELKDIDQNIIQNIKNMLKKNLDERCMIENLYEQFSIEEYEALRYIEKAKLYIYLETPFQYDNYYKEKKDLVFYHFINTFIKNHLYNYTESTIDYIVDRILEQRKV